MAASTTGNGRGHHVSQRHAHAHAHEVDDELPAPVEKLLRERLALLVEAAKLNRAAYANAEVGFGEVASSQMDVLAARLELANTSAERIEIRRDMLEIAKQMEKVATQLLNRAEAPRVDMLKAKALRLQAEAELKREQLAVDRPQ